MALRQRRSNEHRSATGAEPDSDRPEVLIRGTRVTSGGSPDTKERFRCQSTELARATTAGPLVGPTSLLARPHLRKRAAAAIFVRYGLIAAFNDDACVCATGASTPSFVRSAGEKTPTAALRLQPLEWVESALRGGDHEPRSMRMQKNRGLRFDAEMVPYCGKTVRVLRRADRFIDERTGLMVEPRSPCMILENVTCSGSLQPTAGSSALAEHLLVSGTRYGSGASSQTPSEAGINAVMTSNDAPLVSVITPVYNGGGVPPPVH